MRLRFSIVLAGWLGLTIAILPITSTYAFKDASNTTSSIPIAKGTDGDIQESDISRFTDAISQIKDYYVQPISDKKLLEDAIRGMVSGLDPHSEYLDEDAYKSLIMTTNGSFGGLGIEVTGEFGVLKVVSPIDDTPASKAGIKSGDYIVAINNKLVDDMTLNEAVESMRGEKGTPVTLTIIRKDQKAPINIRIVRDEIHITSVKSRMLSPGYGYVRISEFGKPTTDLMVAAIESLKKQAGGHLNGLVLDLRNNPGGLLETAVDVSDKFLDQQKTGNLYNQLIVYTEGRLHGKQYSGKITSKGTAGDILNGAPLVVLVNEGSASASEIVAGALQDYRRALIVGIPSFGKGSVQTVLPLDDTHAIKLTTALYHTPSGRVIQNKGITPDIVVNNLEIAKKSQQDDDSAITPIREFELKGHLPGTENPATASENAKADSLNLARTDFQLYEAFDILKTMHTLGTNIVPTLITPPPAVSKN
ncbi:MAG: S41 family peptidase [Gammaproteobacteria bacterium]|nr:S41 family peptidase [Gammaproteobacteria bacterium]